MKIFKFAILFSLMWLILLACQESSSSNQPQPRISPMASVAQTIGDSTTVTITYSRPGVKGRTIWGELVPLDKVWRTGANVATTISFNKDLVVEGQKLPAGTYALFTIPTKTKWTVIFNKEADQWGAFNYKQSEDALRIEVTPKAADHVEWMDFSFQDLTATSAKVVLRWEKLAVPFNIETTVSAEKPRLSPKATVWQVLGDSTKVAFTFSRPGVKEREIWGALVPYDKVWRTGANENTTLSVSGDVTIEGQKLSAGAYGIHTIPGENEWTVIFSNNAGLWGSRDYKQEEDALRIQVKPQQTGDLQERMLFSFPILTPDASKVVRSAQVVLRWEKLAVPFTVSVQ
ncbi:MAG: DUF2911 domain-containing protein [bacterium]